MSPILRFALAASCALAVIGWSSPARAEMKSYTASIPFVTAKFQLTYGGREPIVYVVFSTDDPQNHSLYCFNGYRDIQYVLRNAAGKSITADPDAWKSYSDLIDGNSSSVTGAPDSCKTVHAGVHQSYIQLRGLFPKVPAGTYTLQVLLAPRESSAQAEFPPLSVIFP